MSLDLDKLNNENNQLKNTLKAFSAQLRSRKQACDELYEANINLRSNQILLEDQVIILKKQIEELEKLKSLENDEPKDESFVCYKN